MSIPRFSRASLAFDVGSLNYDPCDDWIFPSVLRVDGLIERPLGKYYLYCAPHDAPGGICLFFGDSPNGPWTEYPGNPIVTRDWPPHHTVSHISSPHVLWNEAESCFFLYYHGENDTTRLATSRDGIHFTYEGVCVSTADYEGISEASYARVFQIPHGKRSGEWIILFMGNNEGTRRIYSAWSKDGRTFESVKKPLINPPPGTEVTQIGAPWYYPVDGKNLVVFHGDQTDQRLSNVLTDLYVADVGEDFTGEAHLGLFYGREMAGDENLRASDACFFSDEGEQWLFLAVGSRLCQRIAFARPEVQ